MVVLKYCQESESDRAIGYSEKLNGFYFPPSPTYFPPSPTTFPPSPSYFPLYSPPSPPQPSSSYSGVPYVWGAICIFLPQNQQHKDIVDLPDIHVAVLVEYKIEDRGGALEVIPAGRLVRINGLVELVGDIIDSEAKNMASLVEQLEELEYWDHVPSYTDLCLEFEHLEKENENISDQCQLVLDSTFVQQDLIQYRGGALGDILLGRVARINGTEISEGHLLTSTPELALIFQTTISLKIWQGHCGQWVAEIRYGWNWINTVTPLSHESVLRYRGGKENRAEPTTKPRTEFQMLELSPTEEQENPNDQRLVSVSTVECEMAEARLKSGCLGKRKTRERNPGRDKRNKGKTNGVGFVAGNGCVGTEEDEIAEAQLHTGCFGKSSPKEDDVIVKAKYGRYTIKFPLSMPWGKANLEEQVEKRFPELQAGTYLIKYKDEKGKLILITCDEDLQLYIKRSVVQGTTFVVLLERK